MKEKQITAVFMFEMLGRPPEHLKETLSQFVDKLDTIPGIKIQDKKISEPKLIEDEKIKDLFTTFAEVEILANDFNALSLIVFNMLPSHIEIIEPSELRLSNFDLGNIMSDLTLKLHKYDEIAKRITIERNILVKKLAEADLKLKELGEESILKNKIEKNEKEPDNKKEKINKDNQKKDKVKKIKKNIKKD